MSDSESEKEGGKSAQLATINQKKKRSFAELNAETFSQSAAHAEKNKKKRKRSKAAKKANEQSTEQVDDQSEDEKAEDAVSKTSTESTDQSKVVSEASIMFEDRQPQPEQSTDSVGQAPKKVNSRKGKQPKKRSKQKNLRKDNRPDHMKPQFRTVLPRPGQTNDQDNKQPIEKKAKVVVAST